MKRIFYIFTLVLLLAVNIFSQDSSRSVVYKNNFPAFTPIVRLKYPEFTIAEGYYLVKKANEGNLTSQHELGLRYLFGNGFEKDTTKAIQWIRKAADKKLSAACFNYGIMLLNGVGVQWNPFEAFNNFLIAADGGMAEAQLLMGMFYLDNLIVGKNLNKAIEWINKAVKQNYKPAIELLTQIKQNEGKLIDLSGLIAKSQADDINGENSKKDFTVEFFSSENDSLNKAFENAEKKDLIKKPFHELKRFLNINGTNFTESGKDTTSANLIDFGIETGNPEAILLNGTSLEKGNQGQKDLIAAAANYFRAYRLGLDRAGNFLLKLSGEQGFIDILNKSMEKGDPDAIFVWSAVIAMNYNNKFTEDQSIDFLKKGALKNHVQSMVELGLCYFNGRGVQQDRQKAVEIWDTAAGMGSFDAKLRIAINNILNYNSVKPSADDYHSVLKAAENGSILAQNILGYCYEKGIIVAENKAEANKMYRNSARRGSEVGMNSLFRLYNDLRPEKEEFKIY